MAFATIEDLEARLGRAFDVDEDTYRKAAAALDDATETIRSAAGDQQIYPATTETVTLTGNGRDMLQLPQIPVSAVSEVTVLAPPAALVTLPSSHYMWTAEGALYRVAGAAWYGGRQWRGLVTVTYTHGYAVVPSPLRGLCARLALETVMGRQAGIRSESIGSYSVTYSKIGTTVLSDDDTNLVRQYGPVYVP